MKGIPGRVIAVALPALLLLAGCTGASPIVAAVDRPFMPDLVLVRSHNSPPASPSTPASPSAVPPASAGKNATAARPATAPSAQAPGGPTVATGSTALGRLSAALKGGGGKVFGVSPDGNSKGITSVPRLEADLNHPVDIVNIFVGWNQSVPTASMQQIARQGSVPELTLEPWDSTKGVNQPNVADSRIAGGAYDAYLKSFAAAAAGWGSPFLLRYAHEMNGNWYPWAASTNGNTANAYVQAWRHVHDIFANAGASNVLWVWCPNAGGPTPVADVFPGRGYVDILAMDGYNWGTKFGGWRTPDQIFSPLLATVTALAPGTPVLVNETGSVEQGGSKAAWVNQLFSFLRAQRSLVGVVYSNFGSAWSLYTSSAALAAAKSSLLGI